MKIMLVGTHQRTTEAYKQHLILEDHVEYISNKILSRLGILRRARKVLSKPTCQMLSKTIVLPLFDYCSPVWDSCGVGSKAYLDKLNRRADLGR